MYTYSDYQAQTSLLRKLNEDLQNERRNGWEVAAERIEKQYNKEVEKWAEIYSEMKQRGIIA